MKYINAKLDLIINLGKIKEMLKKGFSKLNIYQELKQKGEIRCSQASFYRVTRKYIDLNEIDNAIKTEEQPKKSLFKNNNF
ncbi:MAG: hypothetical protein AB7U85_10205 [Alphaproteobacteria bacterium]